MHYRQCAQRARIGNGKSASVLEMKVGRMVLGFLATDELICKVHFVGSGRRKNSQENRLENLSAVILQAVSETTATMDQLIPSPCPMDTD